MRKKTKNNFWNFLPKYPKLLAPMADVTDIAFRKMIAKYSRMGEEGGGPDVLFTEFVSADGLCSDEGREKLLPMLAFDSRHRPIVAQIFSTIPNNIFCAAKICLDLGFDGVDLNMGCPEKNIVKQGAGSAMIKTPELAKNIIHAAKEALEGKIPLSVKTRIGWNKDEVDIWIPKLIEAEPDAIILHGRTRSEMSKVPAHWESIARAAELVHKSGKNIKLIGNGDIKSLQQAEEYQEKYKVDGVMIGRGVFGKPWFFDSISIYAPKNLEERFSILLEHTRLFLELLPHKNFQIMKKHYKAYVNGFDGAKELRVKLMEAHSFEEIEKEIKNFLSRKNIF